MRFGFRRPSLRKRIASRTSWKRYVRHSLGLKMPRGYGLLTNPRRALSNRMYHRATRPTCAIAIGVLLSAMLACSVVVVLLL